MAVRPAVPHAGAAAWRRSQACRSLAPSHPYRHPACRRPSRLNTHVAHAHSCFTHPSTLFVPPSPLHYLLQKPATFFTDEWRTPTYVKDLAAACAAAVERYAGAGSGSGAGAGGAGGAPLPCVGADGRVCFNVGGPQRLNRHDMALAVAEVRWRVGCGWCWAGLVSRPSLTRSATPHPQARGQRLALLLACLRTLPASPIKIKQVRGYDPALALPGSAADVARTCATPADISMDCSAAERHLGLALTPFAQALREIFGGACGGGGGASGGGGGGGGGGGAEATAAAQGR